MKIVLGLFVSVVLSWPVLAQGNFEGPGRYEIANIKSGKVLEIDRGDQSTVIQSSPRGTDSQAWEIRPAGGGFFILRNLMNGYALDAGRAENSEPVRAVPLQGNPGQQWRFEPGKDGNALVVSRLGKTLDIPDGTSREGARVQVYELNGDSNQRFRFRRVSLCRGGNWGGPGWEEERAGGVISCASNNGERVYCDADTRGGAVLVRQVSGSPCREGTTWGYDRRGIWVDRGCRAEFSVGGGPSGGEVVGGDRTLTCSSDNGGRVFCEADVRGQAVQMVRQISGSPCREGETWGRDERGIWVDRGCRAEFAITRMRPDNFGGGRTITCSSDNGGRVYCETDVRGQAVQMVRQISGSPCRQGETWGWDRRGIWVDRGCRAEFSITPAR
jgi:Protein of unknown function (DUF3011)/Ricin-type beta-trefoil lectin domain-like